MADEFTAAPDTRGSNLYELDKGFQQLLDLYLSASVAAHIKPELNTLGYRVANDLDECAMLANAHPPILHHRDRFGRDHQWIEYHPAYRQLEEAAFGTYGLHAMSHRSGVLDWPGVYPIVAKHAFTYLFNQAEFGLGCPINVTDSTAHLIQRFGSEFLKRQFLPRLLSQDMTELWQGAQFMTERQGGSDVGQITTVARKDDSHWLIHGEKWFCSNADAQLATILARPEGAESGTRGLGLFVVPRTREDGSRNHVRIVRLKDKLGTRSMASGELIFEGAIAYQVGRIEDGFRNMTEMINWSRLSNGVKSAALMRRAVHDANTVAHGRQVFGRKVIEHPLAQSQLVGMTLLAEQALSMWFFAARSVEESEAERLAGKSDYGRVARLATPVLKFRATRDARAVTTEAMEFRGGSGYIEDFVNPRLVRDAMLGSIWEGTSNIIAIDVVRRAILRNQCLDTYRDRLDHLLGEVSALASGYVNDLRRMLDDCCSFAARAADTEDELAYRDATTRLYDTTTAILMAWEGDSLGRTCGDASRALWSKLILERHGRESADRVMHRMGNDFLDALTTSDPQTVSSVNALLT